MYENSRHMCNIRNPHLYRYLLSQLLQNITFDTELFINGILEFSQFKLTDLFVNTKDSENCLSPDDIHTLNKHTKLSAASVPLLYLNFYIYSSSTYRRESSIFLQAAFNAGPYFAHPCQRDY